MTKNSGKIQCELCGSVILLPETATLTKVPDGIFLPPMKTNDKEGVNAHEFWAVTDMFAFENVGFCNTVDNIKYLACADCDVGPIGAHFLNNKNMFYVSPLRVKHVVSTSSANEVPSVDVVQDINNTTEIAKQSSE